MSCVLHGWTVFMPPRKYPCLYISTLGAAQMQLRSRNFTCRASVLSGCLLNKWKTDYDNWVKILNSSRTGKIYKRLAWSFTVSRFVALSLMYFSFYVSKIFIISSEFIVLKCNFGREERTQWIINTCYSFCLNTVLVTVWFWSGFIFSNKEHCLFCNVHLLYHQVHISNFICTWLRKLT